MDNHSQDGSSQVGVSNQATAAKSLRTGRLFFISFKITSTSTAAHFLHLGCFNHISAPLPEQSSIRYHAF